MKAFFAVVGAVLVAAIIGVAGWQFNWWLEGKNVDKRVQIQNHNKGVQVAWMDEIRSSISDYQLTDPSNTAARGALRNQACTLINRLTDSYRDADIERFERNECGSR